MTANGKIIVLGSLGLALAGAGYYFFVYRKGSDALSTVNAGITAANSSAGRSLTLADLKAKAWKNPQGISGTEYIAAFNPATGVVSHTDPRWTGILLDPQTISWTKDTGETQIWKSLNGLGSIPLTTGYKFI